MRARILVVAVMLVVGPRLGVLGSPPNAPVAPAGALPEGIHVAYGADPRAQVTISWQTGGERMLAQTADVGSYAEVGETTSYGRRVAGWEDGYGEYPVVVAHHVAIEGLSPGVRYHYRVGDGVVWSDDFTFTTAPPVPAPFRIAALGDMGSDTSSAVGNALGHLEAGESPADPDDVPPHSGRTLAGMIAADPDLVLFLGDVSYSTEYQPEWDEWFRFWEPLGARVATMFASGNHEHEDGPWADRGFFTRVALPGNERNFSYDYGGIHFVVADTERTSDPEQIAWLAADLQAAAANPETPWIVVYFHKPPYGTGGHRSNGSVRHRWTPLFDAYGVDLVLAGHNHNYERTYPVAYDEQVAGDSLDDYTDPPAPIYVVSGGGGISLEGDWVEPKPAWSAVRELDFEFLTLDVDPRSSITVTSTRSDDATVIDRFVLRKDVCASAALPSWC